MTVKISHKELHERCLVEVAPGSDFTIYNLPLGIFETSKRPAGVGMAIGDCILDLRVLAESGLFQDITHKSHFESDKLNGLMAQGRKVTDNLRQQVQSILTGDSKGFSVLREQALVKQSAATMLMPVEVGDYTDFYSSEEHARNVGKLFRSEENALMPNWKHLPVGYHGRASSLITTGTAVRRPSGQILEDGSDKPVFSKSRRMDFELELAYIVGKPSDMGQAVDIDHAEDHIYGFVLMNDWSARDIQKWEYRPLGPFLGKSFATSISPWVVCWSALEPYKVEGPKKDVEVLDYLISRKPGNFNINLEVDLHCHEGHIHKLTRANSALLYWSAAQQLAHHTVNGCNLKIGDLMASGTISGKTPGSWGSLLEQTYNGKTPISIAAGIERSFLEDGDAVEMRGHAGEGAFRIGFGQLMSTLEA